MYQWTWRERDWSLQLVSLQGRMGVLISVWTTLGVPLNVGRVEVLNSWGGGLQLMSHEPPPNVPMYVERAGYWSLRLVSLQSRVGVLISGWKILGPWRSWGGGLRPMSLRNREWRGRDPGVLARGRVQRY